MDLENLPPSLDFHLSKARIRARYMGNPKRNLEIFGAMKGKGSEIEQAATMYGMAISYFEHEKYHEAKVIMDKLLAKK